MLGARTIAVALAAALLALAGAAGAARADSPAGPRGSWPRPEVLDLAMRAFRCGQASGHIARALLTVIDYSLPSTERRLWVIDVARRQVLFHELVAHGRNSGDNVATAFSNRLGSLQTSLGLFRAEDTYVGQHGLALRLTGLEPGVNDLAEERRIVVHGADYVSPTFAARHGRLGRSWGCPALAREAHRAVIDQIRDGSAVFAYYPDRDWLRTSGFLHCAAGLTAAAAQPLP